MAERYGAEIDHARLASAADLRLNAATGGSMWLSLEPSDASRHQALYRKSSSERTTNLATLRTRKSAVRASSFDVGSGALAGPKPVACCWRGA